MTPGFVAAVLEGFEATLDAVLERLEDGDLKREVEALQEHISSKRQQFEARESRSRSHPSREACRASFCAGLRCSGPRLAHTSKPRRPGPTGLLRFRRSRQV